MTLRWKAGQVGSTTCTGHFYGPSAQVRLEVGWIFLSSSNEELRRVDRAPLVRFLDYIFWERFSGLGCACGSGGKRMYSFELCPPSVLWRWILLTVEQGFGAVNPWENLNRWVGLNPSFTGIWLRGPIVQTYAFGKEHS